MRLGRWVLCAPGSRVGMAPTRAKRSSCPLDRDMYKRVFYMYTHTRTHAGVHIHEGL